MNGTIGFRKKGSVWARVAVCATAVLWINPARAEVAAGNAHSLGLSPDGWVMAVGSNSYGQCETESWWPIMQIAAGAWHSVGLTTDGRVFAVGNNSYGQCDVESWTHIKQVAAGSNHTLGLKADGTVLAVGANDMGQCDVDSWSGIVQLAAGGGHSLGLTSDLEVVATGSNVQGQCNVQEWSGIKFIAAGNTHSLGVTTAGRAVAAGNNTDGQCNVDSWSDVIQVAGGKRYSLGLKSDRTVVAVGDNTFGQCDVDAWSDIIQISSSLGHSLGLQRDGFAVATGWNNAGQCDVDAWPRLGKPLEPVPNQLLGTTHLDDGDIVLSYEIAVQQGSHSGPYTIHKAKGRFGSYQILATTEETVYTDPSVAGNPYDYCYKVYDFQGELITVLSLEIELFGPNMYILGPEDTLQNIGQLVDRVSGEMWEAQFSLNRYAFYFKPGDYTGLGTLSVCFYTHLGGLGQLPYDTLISNTITPPSLGDNNATHTFWRSAENFTLAGASNDEDFNTWFNWGVSQAAPIRRLYSEKRALFQFGWPGGWCSGGFTGDCYFEDAAGSNNQQQWYYRNSYIEKGSEGYAAGGWNLAYQGVEFGPNVDMALHSDNWEGSRGTWNKVSRVETTPVIREKPFLFLSEEDGRYKVFKPGLRYDSTGVSWGPENMGFGTIHDLLDEFYLVKPGTTAAEMNQKLDLGKHLFITPGIYELSEPLHVKHANTIVLGTGYATLIPGESNSDSALVIDDVGGVTIASLLFDTYYTSNTLARIGPEDASADHSDNPTLLADVFFRIGGILDQGVHVDTALVINANDVIGDHLWIWRADHYNGVGWYINTVKNGLIVNGDYVTIYGLFNEHFQEYQAIWNGEFGELYFLQCETPYDVPNQAAYMSHGGTVKGYAAYKVGDHVQHHQASMIGIYDVFVDTNGAEIAIENSIEVPDSPGVHIHHACNVSISPLGGIHYIINGQVPSTFSQTIGNRYQLIDYPETQTWAGYPVDAQGNCDTTPWLNWLWVTTDPWVWSFDLSHWLYCPGENVTESGAWVYIPK
ncbi:MAG: hypothetical protein AB3N33_06060 [Puniceicoccaceae bacterium]